jgi:5-methylcytosine-specific restriction endonuclease McrA
MSDPHASRLLNSLITRPVYGKGRFPEQLGHRTCRGCHEPVPSNRQSWCSNICYNKYHPTLVTRAVYERDGRKCVQCGYDFAAAEKEYWAKRKTGAWFPRPSRPEFDHIIPFVEGGLTIVANMRTLCHECHRKVTAAWRAAKAIQRRGVPPPSAPAEPQSGTASPCC